MKFLLVIMMLLTMTNSKCFSQQEHFRDTITIEQHNGSIGIVMSSEKNLMDYPHFTEMSDKVFFLLSIDSTYDVHVDSLITRSNNFDQTLYNELLSLFKFEVSHGMEKMKVFPYKVSLSIIPRDSNRVSSE